MTETKRSLKATNEKLGELVIIRPSELATNGTTGVVAEGVYEGRKPNKFNAQKNDYFIRNGTTLYIVNETKSLGEQLNQLDGEEGKATVEVVYNGKLSTKNGRGYHDFEVFVK